MPTRPRATGLLATLLLVVSACAPAFIPGTSVEDTPENRDVVGSVELYRKAMEDRDEATLLRMVSRRYGENGSTTDTPDDDYGYETLTGRVLPKLHDNIKEVQYRVMVRRIGIHADRAFAEYEYVARFLFSEGGRDRWQALNDFNRLDFIREDGVWKIESGL